MIRNFLQEVQEVKEAGDIARLTPLLMRLSSESRKILCKEEYTLKDIVELSLYITKIRQTLAELAPTGHALNTEVDLSVLLAHLQDCYLDLEGSIKEQRNDLYRRSTRSMVGSDMTIDI